MFKIDCVIFEMCGIFKEFKVRLGIKIDDEDFVN